MWSPPALTATEKRKDEESVTTQPRGDDDDGSSCFGNILGADFMFSPFNSPGFADVPRHDIQGDCHSHSPESKNENSRLCLDLDCSTDFKTDANLMDVKNGKNNTVASDCSINTSHMNFMPHWCEPVAGYPIKAHGPEAKSSRINRLPISCSSGTSVLPLVGNFDVTGNNNVPLPFSSPQNVDGNFLSLGIGGGSTEIKSNSNFSTREIASKLQETVSSQFNNSFSVGLSPIRPWNFTPLTGLASGVQTDAGRLSSLVLASSSSSNPIQFAGLRTPQANPELSFSAPSGIPIVPQSGHVAQSPLGPQITRPQVIPWQQQYNRRSSINASSESSRNYLSGMHRGSAISHAQLGRLIPMTEARKIRSIAGGCFPGSVQPLGKLTLQAEGTSRGVANICPSTCSVHPVGLVNTSPDLSSVAALGNSLSPIPIVSPIQSAAAGTFPRRLGVQPNEPTVRNIRGPPAIHLPDQTCPVRPLLPSGHHQHGMPAQLPMNLPRPDYSTGQVNSVERYGVRPQFSPFGYQPHLKRQAIVNPSTAHLSQRRKISPQPVAVNHFALHQRPSFPATQARTPATSLIPHAPHHIKNQGFDEPVEPSGHKCRLCKRDVSFASEGQVYQPAIPPAVAILPCGHTFHDDCLQRITPQDHLKNPPCIPCALGET
ncbi:hypothetical protein OROMI_004278 [Orobanche minor]